MKHKKLWVDTNIAADYLGHRDPFFENAQLLMYCGLVREVELFMTMKQICDLIFILTNGGCKSEIPEVLDDLKKFKDFITLVDTPASLQDKLYDTDWEDPEDALIHEIALIWGADAIITRDKDDFAKSVIPIYDCNEYFAELASRGIYYSLTSRHQKDAQPQG